MWAVLYFIYNYLKLLFDCFMVLLGRIELPTSPLPRECSTTELQQHISGVATNRKSISRQVYFRYSKVVKKQSRPNLLYQV